LSERPSTATLVGGAIVIAAIVIQTRGAPADEPEKQASGASVPPP
jgi:hypothetical protein